MDLTLRQFFTGTVISGWKMFSMAFPCAHIFAVFSSFVAPQFPILMFEFSIFDGFECSLLIANSNCTGPKDKIFKGKSLDL